MFVLDAIRFCPLACEDDLRLKGVGSHAPPTPQGRRPGATQELTVVRNSDVSGVLNYDVLRFYDGRPA